MKIGDIELKWLGHASFLIKNEKTIYIDPYNIYEEESADIILITHPHYDHCSIQDIEKIVKEDTIIIVPVDCQSKITKLNKGKLQIIEAGQTLDFGVKIEAVPAYNINKNFHLKEEGWLGYIIKIDSLIIYHAGDTDMIPEMKNLTEYRDEREEFIALLPIGGTYTMDAKEAAEAASIIKPSLVIPMHYGSIVGNKEDAEEFRNLCREKRINAEILEIK